MVENSLGRLWMLNFPESMLCQKWDYYIAPDAEHEDFIRIDGPEDITLCDPACGSGHILVYAFQLLFDMYVERGYREREIPQLILEKNLSGMEIDPRAAQIANLALAMCAREHDRRFFGRGVQADVLVVAPTKFQRDEAGCVIELPEDAAIMVDQQFIDALEHLDEVGSLLNPTEAQLAALRADANRFASEAGGSSLFKSNLGEKLQDALRVCEALARKFDCVVANPPYMGSSSFSPFMSKWIKKNYPDVKSDLCTCFIERIVGMCKAAAFAGLTTSNSWMFLSSFEVLRQHIVNDLTIETLVQLSVHGFHGIAAQVCTFVLRNSYSDGYLGAYIRLNDFDHHSLQEPKTREAIANPDCGYFYCRNAKTFTQIPGTPIAYWASEALLRAFESCPAMSAKLETRVGMATADNDRFLRLWFEVARTRLTVDCRSLEESAVRNIKWVPYTKGGDYRKWYGNRDYCVDWSNNGMSIKQCIDAKTGRIRSHNYNGEYSFRPHASWSYLSSSKIHLRFMPEGCLFDSTSGTGFAAENDVLLACIALVNSSFGDECMSFLAPTLAFKQGEVEKIPYAINEETARLNSIVESNINLAIEDYDSFETSWDFKRHPLL